MTEQSLALTETGRDSLRAKIEAAERRNAERTLADDAREAAQAAADYTRAHPLTVIGGALAAGLVIGLLTRPGRRVARRMVNSASGAASSASSSVKGITNRGGSRIGTMFGEALIAYIMTVADEVMETARTGQEKAAQLGDAAGAQTRKFKTGAVDAADSAAANSRNFARKTRDQTERVVKDLRRKAKR